MFKRRTTVDPAEKQKRNKQIEIFNILDLCLQISNDDKLILRNRIKQEDKEITNHFLKHKKDKNYQLLQINLRKTLQTIKGNNKLNLIQQLRGSSAGKRPQTPINMKKKNNITESSYPTSIQNSLHSSPTTQKPPVKAKINLNQINLQKHIENEIDRQIKRGIQGQQIVMVLQDITPRQQEGSDMVQKNVMTDIGNNGLYEFKDLIKSKMYSKTQKTENQERRVSKKLKINKNSENTNWTKANFHEHEHTTKRISRDEDEAPTLRNPKYGQFYKRIRMVIEENHP